MTIDLKVSGTSVPGITVTGGRVGGISEWPGITVTGGRVGGISEWPGIHGKTFEVALPRLVAASWPDLTGVAVPRPFSVGLLLIGDTAPAFYSLLEAVRAVVETTATVTLTRIYTNLSGDVTTTAKAVYLSGMDPTMESDAIGRCVPRWQLLAEWA